MGTFLLVMVALFVLVAWMVGKGGKKTQSPPTAQDDARPLRAAQTEPEKPIEDRDAYEGYFGDTKEQRSIKKTVQIDYRDGNGNTTTRTFDIQKFEPNGLDGMILGWCHLRRARRTLRFDRIAKAVDMETGEIIQDLQARLNQEWEASIEPVLDRLFAEHGDALKLMLYAAKADGAMRAKELGVIAHHCADIAGDHRINSATVKELMGYVELPTERSFTITYNKLRREQPEMAQRIARVCREIVGTQASVHPTEQAMLNILDKPLSKAG